MLKEALVLVSVGIEGNFATLEGCGSDKFDIGTVCYSHRSERVFMVVKRKGTNLLGLCVVWNDTTRCKRWISSDEQMPRIWSNWQVDIVSRATLLLHKWRIKEKLQQQLQKKKRRRRKELEFITAVYYASRRYTIISSESVPGTV